MSKAFFIDKDGTLVNYKTLSDEEDHSAILTDEVLYDDVVEGLKHLNDKGYKLIVISNQPWISRGIVKHEEVEDLFRELINNLKDEGVFIDFLTKGISKMPPAVVYGLDAHNRPVVAFYVPPIIEIQNSEAVLVDGIHRSYVCDSAGTTINAVHISGPISPLPFDPIFWRNAQLVKDKPPIEERYVNLRRELFRDLGAVGIDG